ncbi:putative fatty acid elongation protein 3 [Orchesella cincta]|uniref:Elongation of very long chain fatty acids protein n=1 Tax=Orchesella cincta TaxID=48709 RepID=A0A1D2NJW8_ORCCI|nr:putative fatty acid elongation protein 3 [Orchesella cincta]
MRTFEMQNFTENSIGYSGWKFDDPPIFEPFSWEIIDKEAWINYALDTWKLPIYAGIVYIMSIFSIQTYMKDKPAFDLKAPLFYWNAALGVFSILGLIRFTPSFLNILFSPNGFYRSICVRDGANEPASFWYHHMITCCVAWILAPFVEPVARWYIVMNYAVHSVMYPYFALKVNKRCTYPQADFEYNHKFTIGTDDSRIDRQFIHNVLNTNGRFTMLETSSEHQSLHHRVRLLHYPVWEAVLRSVLPREEKDEES